MAFIVDEEYSRSGIQIRKRILGPERVRKALAAEDDLIEYHHLFGHECAYANIWSRPELAADMRSLCVVGMLAAVSPNSETFRVHVRGAIRNGASRSDIRQVLATVSFYLGAGVGTDAIGAARLELKELASDSSQDDTLVSKAGEAEKAPSGSRDELIRRGRQLRLEILGEEKSGSSVDASAAFERLSTAYVFGVLWSDPAMEPKKRMLLVLAILCADNRMATMAQYMAGAKRLGCRYEDVKEVLLAAFIYGGMPAAAEGFEIARAVFEGK